jgi:hypothetical protein
LSLVREVGQFGVVEDFQSDDIEVAPDAFGDGCGSFRTTPGTGKTRD